MCARSEKRHVLERQTVIYYQLRVLLPETATHGSCLNSDKLENGEIYRDK